MTRNETTPLSIEATIALHGAWRVFLVALFTLLAALIPGRRRALRKAPPATVRPPAPDIDSISNHLRADLGLPPKLAPPPDREARLVFRQFL